MRLIALMMASFVLSMMTSSVAVGQNSADADGTVLGPHTAGILVLSGGSSPAANHYSQYLQTKTLTYGLRSIFGASSTDVLFGAGNSDNEPKLLADVHREVAGVADMQFGVINGNAPATKDEVRNWFDNAASHLSGKGDTFFLFVSDHGMPNPDSTQGTTNNCINLWAYNADTMSSNGSQAECLSKDELRTLIKTRIPAEKTVFAMSQCFSGGFHQMSVSSIDGYPSADVNLCGFTAITDDSTASGCTADVDGPGYKGYERFFTQHLVGRNVVTGVPMARAASVLEAHEEAMAEDPTKDIPLSTSDYFLAQWASKISDANFTPRVAADMSAVRSAFNATYDTGIANLLGPSEGLNEVIAEKQTRLRRQISLLGSIDPAIKGLITSGTRAALEAKKAAIVSRLESINTQVDALEHIIDPLYDTKLIPAWITAVDGNELSATGLTAQENTLEKTLLRPAIQAGTGWQRACITELSNLKTKNKLGEYEVLRGYCAARETKMRGFFQKLAAPDQVAALRRIRDLGTQEQSLTSESASLVERRDHLRRVLILRSTIAAAVALETMHDSKAIEEARGLSACEHSTF